jgi:UDP-N-acetylglucosamine 4-epimerase
VAHHGAAGFIDRIFWRRCWALGKSSSVSTIWWRGASATWNRHAPRCRRRRRSLFLRRGDIRDTAVCQRACTGIDFVLHQAALGSVPRSIAEPASVNDVNVNGFLNMLIAARDQNVRRLVYASSSAVYGDSQKLPKSEPKSASRFRRTVRPNR